MRAVLWLVQLTLVCLASYAFGVRDVEMYASCTATKSSKNVTGFPSLWMQKCCHSDGVRELFCFKNSSAFSQGGTELIWATLLRKTERASLFSTSSRLEVGYLFQPPQACENWDSAFKEGSVAELIDRKLVADGVCVLPNARIEQSIKVSDRAIESHDHGRSILKKCSLGFY
eukprot:TRINITY_DN1066_c0_g1_i1.p3 TRINITY_DN1066_c0_g1~~TRINITY_DN1066_c0_g1_i1.p3  ORF type:complete len:172 (+),score=17.10 TRINITY_DN1066_c0_g1_i1:1413-1928(+)